MATATAPMPTGAALAGAANAAVPANALATTPANAGTTSPPATTALAPWSAGTLTQNLKVVMAQPAVRKVLPLIVMLAVLVVFGLVYAWMQATPYRPVMPGLQEADQMTAFEALKNADFKPKIDPATGQLTVPSNRYHEARILLASQGLPKTGSTGLDALKDQSSMTTSQLMEQVKINAAMEQELARSIMQIASVQGARVHLATPKQSVFVRDRTPPKDHVTVVDNVGKLLTDSASELKLGMTAAQEQHKQQLEEVYRNRILQILSPMVGEANVRSQVNLSLDFTQIESTTEDFDTRDKGPRTRSEVMSEDRSSQRDAAGIPGALSNTPPANATANANTATAQEKSAESNGRTSSRSTRNYEIDRTVRHVRNASGGIMKVSVAVVVNERPAPPPAKDATPNPNAPTSVAYTQQELERMLQLVQGVVGYDQQRGDLVTVVPAKFEPPSPMETIPWYLEDAVQMGFKSALLAISFIVFMLIVVKPVMRNIIGDKLAASEEEQAKALADGELSEEDMKMIQIGEGESLEEIKAKLKPKKSSISIDMLDTANTYDDKVALIRMLVAEDSARVANVLKGMIKIA